MPTLPPAHRFERYCGSHVAPTEFGQSFHECRHDGCRTTYSAAPDAARWRRTSARRVGAAVHVDPERVPHHAELGHLEAHPGPAGRDGAPDDGARRRHERALALSGELHTGIGLVLGGIEAQFCNEILILQDFSRLQD